MARRGITVTKGVNIVVKALLYITIVLPRKLLWIFTSFISAHECSFPHSCLAWTIIIFRKRGQKVSICKGFLSLRPGILYHWKLSVPRNNDTSYTQVPNCHLKSIRGKFEICPRCFRKSRSFFLCVCFFFLFSSIALYYQFSLCLDEAVSSALALQSISSSACTKHIIGSR